MRTVRHDFLAPFFPSVQSHDASGFCNMFIRIFPYLHMTLAACWQLAWNPVGINSIVEEPNIQLASLCRLVSSCRVRRNFNVYKRGHLNGQSPLFAPHPPSIPTTNVHRHTRPKGNPECRRLYVGLWIGDRQCRHAQTQGGACDPGWRARGGRELA